MVGELDLRGRLFQLQVVCLPVATTGIFIWRRAISQKVWGTEVPSGVHGEAPVRGHGTVFQKLKQFADIVYRF